MLLLIHIAIAIVGLALSTLAAILPSSKKIILSKILILSTLLSGTALVLTAHSSLASACLAGLAYTAATSTMVVIAHRRLAAETI